MFIHGLTNADALPTLETGLRFAARRHTLIAHNIANFDTPGFQPRDVSVRGFRDALAEAVDQRRQEWGGARGALKLRDTREIRFEEGGGMRLAPRRPTGNILFHDKNNRDLEHVMQDLVENTSAFRLSAELLRSRFELLGSAIAERV